MAIKLLKTCFKLPGSWDKNDTCFRSYFPHHDTEVVELGENTSVFEAFVIKEGGVLTCVEVALFTYIIFL